MIDLALRDRLDRYEDALQSIVQWSEAYPLDIFPEPDWKAARKLLEAGGISLDSTSRLIACAVWWKASARSQGKRWETADVLATSNHPAYSLAVLFLFRRAASAGPDHTAGGAARAIPVLTHLRHHPSGTPAMRMPSIRRSRPAR